MTIPAARLREWAKHHAELAVHKRREGAALLLAAEEHEPRLLVEPAMTPTDLRIVVAEIRELASKATPGTWRQDEWTVIDADQEGIVAQLRGPYWTSDGNGGHIAAWSPPVALAVADWLENEAEAADYLWESLSDYPIAFVKAWRGES